MRRLHLFAYSSSLVLVLSACGGGGGDGTSSAVSNNRSPVPPQVALTYAGATTGATVTATSAGPIAANVVGSSGAALGGSVLAGVAVQGDPVPEQPTGATGLGRRLGQAIRADSLVPAGSGNAVAGAAISQTIACDSGSITISGSVDDNTGQGSAAVDYIDCRTGSDTINGPAQLTIRGYNQANRIVTDGTLNFTRVRFSGPGINWDVGGRVSTQVSTSSATETFTLEDVVVQDNNSSRMLRAENLRFVNSYDTVTPPSSFFNQSISGRVYDSAAGYVDISTEFAPYTSPWGPLYYATRNQSFPDWGIINLTGASGRARITSIGVGLAKVEVDSGSGFPAGGGARLRWSEFGTPIAANLADADGDGIHDGYETAKGISDPNADNDGDGYTNLTEYLRGSDAATNGSVPSDVRHIWVTNNTDLAADPSGQVQVFLNGSTSGVLLDTATDELGATFSGGTPSGAGRTSAPDSQGRTFTLTATADPRVWTLTSSAGPSITVTNVAGTDPSSLIRYGARGLAFRTLGVNTPGYVYLVESRTLIP